MSDSTLFFKGIPTAIDKAKLEQKYGVPKEGDELTFQDAAKVMGIDRSSCRFHTVMDSWRKDLLRTHNILLVAVGDGVLRAANPDERMDYASRKVASGRRAVGKAVVVAYGTDSKRLDEKKQAARLSICAMNETKLRLAAGVMPK